MRSPTDIDDELWTKAVLRERVIRTLAGRPITRAEATEAAAKLGESVTWVYRLRRRYEADPRTQSLVPGTGGRPKGMRLLSPEVEAVVSKTVRDVYASRQKPSISAVHRDIAARCRETGLNPPSKETIRRRIRAENPVRLLRQREGYSAAQAKVGPSKGSLEASEPLEIVQIDHTLVDVIIVDEVQRKPIGRPWLTLVIDVHTRTVPGFVLSLDPPSRLSVALAITQAAWGKSGWLKDRGIPADWPCRGLFGTIKLDNAKEFHSEALRRGCEQYGMTLDYRPRGAPWYGGHVERMMGTLMTECHLLPGSTFSNVQARGNYDSDSKAVMTRAELETWLAGRIAGIYHNRIHKTLGITPLAKWRAAEEGGWHPREAEDREALLLDFLPFERRTPRRDGLRLFNMVYWHTQMAIWAARKPGRLPVRYDPRDLSRVWLETPDGDVEPLVLKRADRPPITLWEHRAAQASLRARGAASIDEDSLFAALEEGRRTVTEAAGKTREARRNAQRLADSARPVPDSPDDASPGKDYIPKIYDVEQW